MKLTIQQQVENIMRDDKEREERFKVDHPFQVKWIKFKEYLGKKDPFQFLRIYRWRWFFGDLSHRKWVRYAVKHNMWITIDQSYMDRYKNRTLKEMWYMK